MGELTQEAEVLVIGSGPGGYAAAFRAADLGLDVTMVDPGARPGGVCLYKGCIPSKTFLYLTELIYDAARAETMGVSFGKPSIDLEALRKWKGKVIDQMANGLVSLNNRRGIQLLKGQVQFESSDTVRVHDCEVSHIKFRHAVVATGSQRMYPRNSLFSGADMSAWNWGRYMRLWAAGSAWWSLKIDYWRVLTRTWCNRCTGDW
jgi:dihydrolipoamide dehydrogenase